MTDSYGNTYQKITVTVMGDGSDLLTSYYYNGRDQLMKESRVFGDGRQFKEYAYDYMGNTVLTRGFDGAETSWEYDALGNVLSSKDANGNRTSYGYDMLGNQISVTDALGATTYA